MFRSIAARGFVGIILLYGCRLLHFTADEVPDAGHVEEANAALAPFHAQQATTDLAGGEQIVNCSTPQTEVLCEIAHPAKLRNHAVEVAGRNWRGCTDLGSCCVNVFNALMFCHAPQQNTLPSLVKYIQRNLFGAKCVMKRLASDPLRPACLPC